MRVNRAKTQAGLELNTTCSKSRATQAQIPRGVEIIAWPMLVHPLLHVTLIHKVQLVTLQTQPRSENCNQCSEVSSLTRQLFSNFHNNPYPANMENMVSF